MLRPPESEFAVQALQPGLGLSALHAIVQRSIESRGPVVRYVLSGALLAGALAARSSRTLQGLFGGLSLASMPRFPQRIHIKPLRSGTVNDLHKLARIDPYSGNVYHYILGQHTIHTLTSETRATYKAGSHEEPYDRIAAFARTLHDHPEIIPKRVNRIMIFSDVYLKFPFYTHETNPYKASEKYTVLHIPVDDIPAAAEEYSLDFGEYMGRVVNALDLAAKEPFDPDLALTRARNWVSRPPNLRLFSIAPLGFMLLPHSMPFELFLAAGSAGIVAWLALRAAFKSGDLGSRFGMWKFLIEFYFRLASRSPVFGFVIAPMLIESGGLLSLVHTLIPSEAPAALLLTITLVQLIWMLIDDYPDSLHTPLQTLRSMRWVIGVTAGVTWAGWMASPLPTFWGVALPAVFLSHVIMNTLVVFRMRDIRHLKEWLSVTVYLSYGERDQDFARTGAFQPAARALGGFYKQIMHLMDPELRREIDGLYSLRRIDLQLTQLMSWVKNHEKIPRVVQVDELHQWMHRWSNYDVAAEWLPEIDRIDNILQQAFMVFEGDWQNDETTWKGWHSIRLHLESKRGAQAFPEEPIQNMVRRLENLIDALPAASSAKVILMEGQLLFLQNAARRHGLLPWAILPAPARDKLLTLQSADTQAALLVRQHLKMIFRGLPAFDLDVPPDTSKRPDSNVKPIYKNDRGDTIHRSRLIFATAA
jgi:hypothetical protein